MIKKSILAISLFGFCINTFASAGIGLSPMIMELKQCSEVGVFTVTNSGNTLEQAHAQAKLWTQPNGKDVHVPADNLIVTPPLFSIPPHSKQVLRIGLRTCASNADVIEQAYRINVSQIKPTVTNKNTKDGNKSGVNFLYGFDVPIYVEPKNIIHNYTWQAKKSGQTTQLLLVNRGNVRVAVYELKVYDADGKLIKTTPKGLSAALAGKTVTFAELPAGIAGDKLKISGKTSWGNFSETVAIN